MIVENPNSLPSRYPDGWRRLRATVRDRFSLEEDKDDEQATILAISKGVEFRGINLWTLIFAIFIASIGLNVNSPAVIIGAMLISPLMGPIMGIGLGIGINDLNLILRALKNLSIAVFISLLTSTLYFAVSPLSTVQSELLARTSPTVWDAFIALFGGLAGIIASSRRDKVTNVVPGVAIATALMPPICTAGFGLATGHWYYFAGAFYLFLINSVCISLATYLMVRFLQYHQKEYPTPEIERRVRQTIWLSVLVVVIPSTYLGYQIVRKTIFEQAAKRFVNNECNFTYRQVINYAPLFNRNRSKLELTLVGEPLPADSVSRLQQKMGMYGMGNALLVVKQGSFKDAEVDVNAITDKVTDRVIKYSQTTIAQKDLVIDSLKQHLERTPPLSVPLGVLQCELKAILPDVQAFSAANTVLLQGTNSTPDTILLVYTHLRNRHSPAERRHIENWLRMRTGAKRVRLVVD